MRSVNDQSRHVGRLVLITPLVSSLAVMTLGGCSTTSTRTASNWSHVSPDVPGRDATSAHIDSDGVHGVYTPEWFSQAASKAGVGQQWLGEAQIGIADVEARRASAQAALVQADAQRAERYASAEAARQGAISEAESSRARAATMRESYKAKLEELMAQSEAQEQLYGASIRRDSSMLNAQTKQWDSELERMRSEAEAELERSLAEHERMLAVRESVEKRGQADIDKMYRVISLGDSRKTAQLAAMHTAAQSVMDQSDALVSQIEQQIDTAQRQAQAQATGMREKAQAIRDQADARATELRAEADAIEQRDAGTGFDASNATAAASFDKRVAAADELRSRGEQVTEETLAEVERRRAELQAWIDKAQRSYENKLEMIDTHRKTGLAEIEANRADADRIERTAKAEFLQAEAQARAEAVRERSKHARAIGEEQFKKIQAEAQADAARITSKVNTDMARQVKSGSITLPLPKLDGEADYAKILTAPGIELPNIRGGEVDPQHVVAFKTELARAALMRLDMDMTEADLYASIDEDSAKAEAEWVTAQGDAEAQNAAIDTFRRHGEAESSSLFAQADTMFEESRAEFDAAKADAKSDRRESVAEAASLRAEATAVESRANAEASHLLAQADAMEQTGTTMAQSFAVKRDAQKRRGDAQYRQIMADATAYETSQDAQLALLKEQVRTSERLMESELARLDQAASSFRTIAQVTHDEAAAEADAFEQIAMAHRTEWDASNDASRRMAEADLNYMRELTSSNRLLAQAAVERQLAQSEAALTTSNARDILARAEIDRDSRIASASIAEQFTIADADEMATKSLFDSRIVSTHADRNRAYAASYLQQQHDRLRSNQAIAAAQAFEEMASVAMARLDDASRSFQQAEDPNWSSELAQPTPFGQPTDVATLKASVEQGLVQPTELANVPTDD